jgi:osmoprotectant transport system permease protein
MKEQLALLPGYLSAHLGLTLFALFVGVSVSVPLGVLSARSPRLERPVLVVASVIQTVPSLALLALMVPLLAALDMPSIGSLPAFLALVLYSVLPVLSNTVTGIAGVDRALVEAAQAVGMTQRQQLLRVELPMALPVIVAGIRTAATWTVGMATLSTPVGGVSLGNYIFSGLQTRNYTAVLVGCVAAAFLALVLDALARLALFGLERRRRAPLRASLAGFAALYALAIAGFVSGAIRGGPEPIVIGSKTFTEQYVLAQVMAESIARETRAPTTVKESLGSTVVFDALANGEVDAYVDYSGTIWATIMKRTGSAERARVLAETGRFLRETHGIRLVGALGFENAYALAVRRSKAEELGLRSIGDLARHAPGLSIGGDYEFFQRPEWKAIAKTYDLGFREERSMDPSLMYDAVSRGSVDVISAFSSDGRIVSFDLVVLTDDRGAIPPYDAILLAGKRLVEKEPAALRALESLVGRIGPEVMRKMNLEVDSKKATPREVARAFVEGRFR